MRKAAIKAFSKSYELPPAQDIHAQKQEWLQLSKAVDVRRKQQEADEAVKYAGTPDKPFVQKLMAEEQAVKDRMEATAAEAKARRWEWAKSFLSEEEFERMESLGIKVEEDLTDAGYDIHKGPRGG